MYSRLVDVTLKGLTRQSGGVIRSVCRETHTAFNMRSPPLLLLVQDDNLLSYNSWRDGPKEKRPCLPACQETCSRLGAHLEEWSSLEPNEIIILLPIFRRRKMPGFSVASCHFNCSNVTMSRISGSLSNRSCILTKRGLTGERLNVTPPQAILEPLASFRHLIGQEHRGQPLMRPTIRPISQAFGTLLK
jgi:hypothetical protein